MRVWLVRGWVLATLTVLSGSVLSQTRSWHYCRTAEIQRKVLEQMGITEEKAAQLLRGRGAGRQAGGEVPSILFGTLGTGFYPANGLVGTLRALHLMLRPNHRDIIPHKDHTASYYNRLLFDESNPNSLAAYVREASYGRLRFTGDSYGWLTVNMTIGQSGNITFGTDPFNIPAGWQNILSQAFNTLAPFVDFSVYDSDRDERIDLLFVTVACDPDAQPPNGNPLLDPSLGGFTFSTQWSRIVGQPQPPVARTPQGQAIDCFIYVHEALTGFPSVRLEGFGVYAHEMGHAFGMPDLYNPSDLRQVDPGGWALMSTGDRYEAPGKALNPLRLAGFPIHQDPLQKILLGWLRPVEVTGETGSVVIPPYAQQPVAYRLWAFGSRTQNEYFLVVNRHSVGFDRFLPGRGLNIFHIDKAIYGDPIRNLFNTVQSNPSHKGNDLVDADGRNDMDNAVPNIGAFDWSNFGFSGWQTGNWGDDGDPFPGRTGNTRFEFLTTPSSANYAGLDSGIRILSISGRPDGSMTATVRVIVLPTATVLSPRSNEQTFTTMPTLQVLFSAPLGAFPDIDPNTIQVFVDQQPMPIANPLQVFDPVRQVLTIPMTDSRGQSLAAGRHSVSVRARTRAGAPVNDSDRDGQGGEDPVNGSDDDGDGRIDEDPPVEVDFLVTTRSLSAPGYQMISLPYDFSQAPAGRSSPAYVLGIPAPRLARFGVLNPMASPQYRYGYLTFRVFSAAPLDPYGEFVQRFAPGRAYWVFLDNPVLLAISAPDVDRSVPFAIRNESVWDFNDLDIGWQQVGCPFPFPVGPSAVRVEVRGGRSLSLEEAAAEGVLLGFAYHWTGTGYLAIRLTEWTLQPFTGYWIHKFRPCRLIVAPTPARSAPAREVRNVDGRGVVLEIVGNDSQVPCQLLLRGEGESTPAPPPSPGTTAWGGFLSGSRSSLLLMETTPSASSPVRLVVQSQKGNQTVILRWRNSGGLRGRLRLVDPTTRRSVALVGTGEWKVTTDASGQYGLEVEYRPVPSVPLRIVGVEVTRLRGQGAVIRCVLSAPARAEAEIRTLTGRSVARLGAGASEGQTVRWVWNGGRGSGLVGNSSPLLIRIVAHDDEGRQSQRVVIVR